MGKRTKRSDLDIGNRRGVPDRVCFDLRPIAVYLVMLRKKIGT